MHTEHKLAREAALDYLAILDELRQAQSVYVDETSWWISWAGGQRWLWSFSSDEWSAFRIDPSRGQDAERELRPAVITRKISGGNKTPRGARSWQILKSIECTLDRQERDFIPYLEQTLCLSMPPPTIRPS